MAFFEFVLLTKNVGETSVWLYNLVGPLSLIVVGIFLVSVVELTRRQLNSDLIPVSVRPPQFHSNRWLSGLAVVLCLILFFFSAQLDRWGIFATALIGLVPVIASRQRIRLENLVAARTAELEEQKAALEAENERKTNELEQARRLQLAMLPQSIPDLPHLDIAWHMETATEVGGDYYDYNLAADGTLTVTLGDATGHGMQAGTVVTATKGLFQSLADNPSIIETFTIMSSSLKGMNLERMNMAMTLLKIKDSTLQISAAGMPPMLFYRAATQSVEEFLLPGMPLGVSTRHRYEQQEIHLEPGDTVLLMSDGLPERLNKENTMFGYPQTQALFEEVAEQAPQAICGHLAQGGDAWAEGRPQDDDVTFVALKVKR